MPSISNNWSFWGFVGVQGQGGLWVASGIIFQFSIQIEFGLEALVIFIMITIFVFPPLFSSYQFA